MKQIVGINHVGIRVADLAQSREFYAQLGFEFLAGPMGPEPVAIMEHPSGVNINFILIFDHVDGRGQWRLLRQWRGHRGNGKQVFKLEDVQ